MLVSVVERQSRYPKPSKRTIDLFWSKVLIGAEDECWPFTGTISDGGYGRFWWREPGAPKSEARLIPAHIFARLATDGFLPEFDWKKSVVRHTCDNPPCCNPKHTPLGSQARNIQEASERNRLARKSGLGGAKLSQEQRSEIRERLLRGEKPVALSEEYRVHKTSIYNIAKGRTWGSEC